MKSMDKIKKFRKYDSDCYENTNRDKKKKDAFKKDYEKLREKKRGVDE